MKGLLNIKMENNKPKISIVVPCYNIDNYIEKCIESIRCQTYDNLEIILIDDGSVDRSPDICDYYGKKDNRIVVIHRENGGLSAARNTGIEMATGEFLYFVDGDDLIHPKCIEKLYYIIKHNKSDIALCRTYAFLDETKIPMKLCKEKVKVYTGREMCRRLMFNDNGSDGTIIWNKLYRKSLFNNIRFPEGMIYEDVATTHRLYWLAKSVAVTTQQLAFYRSKRVNSITHSGNQHYEDAIKANEIRNRFFFDRGEKALYEQGLYILGNEITRYRIFKKKIYKKKIIKMHISVVNKILKTNISPRKKKLALIGAICPSLWFLIWSVRQKTRDIAEWKTKDILYRMNNVNFYV